MVSSLTKLVSTGDAMLTTDAPPEPAPDCYPVAAWDCGSLDSLRLG